MKNPKSRLKNFHCIHGGIFDEFWAIYQKWETGWSVVEYPRGNHDNISVLKNVLQNIDRYEYIEEKPKQSWKKPYKFHK